MSGRMLTPRVLACLVREMPWGLRLDAGVEDRDSVGTQGPELDTHKMETL